MKNLLTLLFVIAVSSVTFSQDFEKGGNYISIGYGVDAGGLPGSSSFRSLGIGPIMANYELGITDVIGIGRIGVGVGVGFSHYSFKNYAGLWYSGYDYTKSANRLTIFLKGAYHFEFDVENLDVYAGAGFGVNLDSEKYDYWSNGSIVEGKRSSVGPVHYVFAGARWYFSESFGVYVEVGDGVSNVNAGVVFSL